MNFHFDANPRVTRTQIFCNYELTTVSYHYNIFITLRIVQRSLSDGEGYLCGPVGHKPHLIKLKMATSNTNSDYDCGDSCLKQWIAFRQSLLRCLPFIPEPNQIKTAGSLWNHWHSKQLPITASLLQFRGILISAQRVLADGFRVKQELPI